MCCLAELKWWNGNYYLEMGTKVFFFSHTSSCYSPFEMGILKIPQVKRKYICIIIKFLTCIKFLSLLFCLVAKKILKKKINFSSFKILNFYRLSYLVGGENG